MSRSDWGRVEESLRFVNHSCQQGIYIDVVNRNPCDCPYGIPYCLMAVSDVPWLSVHAIGDIFEEHRICRNLVAWYDSCDRCSRTVYCREEKRFMFNNVLIGTKACARIKLINCGRVGFRLVSTPL